MHTVVNWDRVPHPYSRGHPNCLEKSVFIRYTVTMPQDKLLTRMSKSKYPLLISVLPSGDGSDSLTTFPNLPSYPFLISILPAEEGGGCLIEFPDLPGCMSDGETIEETIENGKDAVACWVEIARRYGDKIPQPDSTAHPSPQRKLTLAPTAQNKIS